jgi:16S rRNA U516 pseudouridylate synthase RsuA-like enzyme
LNMRRDVGGEGYTHEGCCNDDKTGRRNDRWEKRKDDALPSISVPSDTISSITVLVREGKNRMVRRLFAAIDLFVVDLERIKYGEIELGNTLKFGEWRYLDSAEEMNFCRGVVQSWTDGGSGWDKK